MIFHAIKVRELTRWKIHKLANKLCIGIADLVDQLATRRLDEEGIDPYGSVLDRSVFEDHAKPFRKRHKPVKTG